MSTETLPGTGRRRLRRHVKDNWHVFQANAILALTRHDDNTSPTAEGFVQNCCQYSKLGTAVLKRENSIGCQSESSPPPFTSKPYALYTLDGLEFRRKYRNTVVDSGKERVTTDACYLASRLAAYPEMVSHDDLDVHHSSFLKRLQDGPQAGGSAVGVGAIQGKLISSALANERLT